APHSLNAGLLDVAADFASTAARVDVRTAPDAERAAAGLGASALSHLLQIAREAVSNAVRHSRGSAVSVDAQLRRGRLMVEVRDDGSGAVAEELRAGTGYGLRNMLARARLLGGDLEGTSRPGQGTGVRLEV